MKSPQRLPRGHDRLRRGGPYTIAVLSASMLMLTLGATLVMPTRLSLELTGIRRAKLTARQLARAGLEWAGSELAAGTYPRPGQGQDTLITKKNFGLETGSVEVVIERVGANILVRSRGTTKKERGHREAVELRVRFSKAQGRWTIIELQEKPIALDLKKAKKDKAE